MNVGTRITAVASVVVAGVLIIYGVLDARQASRQMRDQVEQETRALARLLRAGIEIQGVPGALAAADELSSELSETHPHTRVLVQSVASRGGLADVSDASRRRLRDLVEARPLQISLEEDGRFVYALPLRRRVATAPDGYEVAGAIEVSRSLAALDGTQREALIRSAVAIGIIVVLVILAVWLFARTLVSRPIEKLLSGIDDVARGDLSRVLLSEREDEIGQLATRFNEMTFSLRESRAETERHNAARTRLEERLFQTEKMATIGQLAAEIAHEVGTPLNVIVGRSRAMAKKANDPEAVAKNAEIVAEQASRITRIIQRLLDTARRKVGASDDGLVQLNDVVLATLEFLESKLSAARVSRELVRASPLPEVKGNADQLQQVLLNLLLNAIEAMPKGGNLTVTTEQVSRRRPGLELAPEQSVVMVSVADNGPGIAADSREHIFEPFYTTKSGRGGTGLGLSVSHGIIKEHDGWIEVDEGPGGIGTVFRVCLPTAQESGRVG